MLKNPLCRCSRGHKGVFSRRELWQFNASQGNLIIAETGEGVATLGHGIGAAVSGLITRFQSEFLHLMSSAPAKKTSRTHPGA